MPRLIDAEVLLKKLDWLDEYDYIEFDAVKRTVDKVPTVDAEPVRHGRWKVVDGAEPRRYGCSICKKLSWTEDNYCSYCGAKMDGERREDADS